MRKISVEIKGLGTQSVDDGLLVELGEGRYEKFYLNEVVDDKYVVDTESKETAEAAALVIATKADNDAALDSLVVEVNTVPFDANDQSINYMSSVLAVANFKMFESTYVLCSAKDEADRTELETYLVSSYEAIYKTTISWRNANNTNSEVQLETVAEALEAGMSAVGSIKTGG